MVNHVIRTAFLLLSLAAVTSAQTPMGAEFRVNTYTTDHQAVPRVAMEPDGDFVVVWRSYGQDGSNYGAFGQRFAAAGDVRGSEFRINTYALQSQSNPVVAVGPNGDFVIVWASEQDGSGKSVHGRRFDASGDPLGIEFQVNTFTPFFQYPPNVARAFDGRFVVSWTTPNFDGDALGIGARRFDAAGNPIGSDFVVNTYTTGTQYHSDVAVEANGDFIAVWEDFRYGDIFGQRYDAVGNRLGSEFQVDSYITGRQAFPSISASPVGGFVVTWSGVGEGDQQGVFSRRFDAAGNAIGNDFLVNTYTTGSQLGTRGQIAHDARGNFVVTWNGAGDGDALGIFAQHFSASGARRGGEFRVNTYTTGIQTLPSVASDSVGNFVVTWQSGSQDGSNYGIFAQRYGDLIFEDGFDPVALSP